MQMRPRWFASLGAAVLLTPIFAFSQNRPVDPRYQTRASDCGRAANASPATVGAPISFRSSDSGIGIDGYVASRTFAHSATARGLTGGTITVCAEYGSVEIMDSPDDEVHVQVHIDAFGEGASDPAAEARSVLRATTMKVRGLRAGRRLALSVVNDTLGFSTPGGQPALTHIRILVPGRGAYTINATAYHGAVAIRRLNLAGLVFRGRVGDKFKGVPGYVGSIVLDNPVLMGNADISIDGENLSPPVLGRFRVGASSRVTVRTGGDVTLAVQPHPDLAVRAVAASNASPVRLQLDGAARDTASTQFQNIQLNEGTAYAAKRIKLQILATSTAGRVSVVSMPAATLAR